jgi:predicted ribosomally synthesized peptide with SipW-like signal peptide
MLNVINTKILISAAVVLTAAALIIGGTFAFFSDTETSTGNVLAAGAIDLQIDNESYVTDVNGDLVASPETSWDLRDLTIEKFFNFTDLKPGDVGEDTISLHVNNNDAWVCAAARVTVNSDETCTEPENTDEDNQCVPETNGQNGDLAQAVNFAFWADDGDNVFEDNESIFLQGPISGLGQAGQIALADTTTNIWQGSGPVFGGQTFHIGKAWCFGDLVRNPAAQGENTNPIERGTGFTCDGADNANNAAQTDKVVGDLQFYAVQSRNNAQFTCANNYEPDWAQ